MNYFSFVLPMLFNCTWYIYIYFLLMFFSKQNYKNWSQQYENHLISDCTGDTNYTKHEDNIAMFPYSISNNIDECACQQRCEGDPRCNGYSFDENMVTCSLSRCNNTNQSITWSIASDFYSKKIPTIRLLCVPVTTTYGKTNYIKTSYTCTVPYTSGWTYRCDKAFYHWFVLKFRVN